MSLKSATNIDSILANLVSTADNAENGEKSKNGAMNYYFSINGRKTSGAKA